MLNKKTLYTCKNIFTCKNKYFFCFLRVILTSVFEKTIINVSKKGEKNLVYKASGERMLYTFFKITGEK